MNRRSVLQSIASLPLLSGLSEHDGSDRSYNELQTIRIDYNWYDDHTVVGPATDGMTVEVHIEEEW